MTVVPPRRVILYARLQRADRARELERVLDAAAGRFADLLDGVRGARIERVRRAERFRELELRIREIDGDDLPRAGRARAEQRREPDAAEADHRHRRARAHLRGVDDGADAGEHGAPEQRGFVERQLRVDLHQRTPRHDCVFREHRAAEMVIDRLAVLRQPSSHPTATCPRRSPRRRARTAPGRPSAHGGQWPQLGTNTITTWSPRFRSVTPSPSASTMPDASWPSAIGIGRGRSPLITERSEWHRPAAAIFTSTSPGPGGASSSVLDRERTSLRERRLRAHRVQHGGVDLHRSSFTIATAPYSGEPRFFKRSVSFMFSRVVDRAVDDRDRVVGERALERRHEIRGALDAIALRAEALRVLHEVGVLERDVARAAEVAQLVPGDEAVLGIVPDQDHERRLHPQRGLDLLRVHQEAGVAGDRDDLAIRDRRAWRRSPRAPRCPSMRSRC